MTFVENLKNDILPFLADEAATASLLKRVLLFLEDGEFIQADSYCEKVLDTEPENALAYLCKLMASRRISSFKDLASTQYVVDSDNSFKKAVRFAPEEMQLHLLQLNTHIYANSIEACRNRAKIHMAHGELKETAQQYHNAMKMWDDSHETLPNADAIYSDLADEIADFNWKLLLHNRQCPDDTQLIARSIPIDNDRWYLSAVKWANPEKKAYFTSVAKDTLFNAHLKCLEYVKSKQTRLAQIWANHYKAAAPNDPLCNIHQALVDTDGFTKFAETAPGAMLKLIKYYQAVLPRAVEETKEILQNYYVKIFQSLLDFTGKEPQTLPVSNRLNEDTYAIMIAQQEANACAPQAEVIPIQDFSTPAEVLTTDPLWATETARKISLQMTNAVSEELSPYGSVSTYLIAAKELTIRYGKKDGIVTEPPLFRFICKYYADAIKQAPQEQASAIQSKFNDFLIDTVRLPSAATEIVAEASGYMHGSTLPYQIFLSRITNNYSVKMENLIPSSVVETLQKWKQDLVNADPARDCYLISDQQKNITAAFSATEEAIDRCRQYTNLLKRNLASPYQQVLSSSGDGQEEISDRWNQQMASLQSHCDHWAEELEEKLHLVKSINNDKLVLAQKHIKVKEGWQLAASIAMNLLFAFTVFALAMTFVTAISTAWDLSKFADALPNRTTFYAINILVPMVAGIFSLVNGMVAPTYGDKRKQKLLWLFAIFGIFTYVSVHLDIDTIIHYPETIGSTARTDFTAAGILALIAVGRTLLEFFLCKLKGHTRSNATQVSCLLGSTIAKVVGLAQALACLGIAALYIYCLILAL